MKLLKNIILIYIIILLILVTAFIWEHDLNNHEIIFDSSLTGFKTEFNPYAYKLIKDNHSWTNYINTNVETKRLDTLNKDCLDFENHMYIVVYGAKIKNMYWSYKSTLFDDVNAPYSKVYRNGRKLIMIEYEYPDNNIYLYKIRKDMSLDL